MPPRAPLFQHVGRLAIRRPAQRRTYASTGNSNLPEPKQPIRRAVQPKSAVSRWSDPTPKLVTDQTPASPFSRGRAVPLVLAAVLAGAMGFYVVRLSIAAQQPVQNPEIVHLENQKDVAARYDDTASGFDSEVGFSEFIMRITTHRAALAAQCRGHVLEASCGTGRNLGYFCLETAAGEKRIKSLTFLDLSPPMIDVCKKKWDALLGSRIFLSGLQTRFVTGSALDDIPPPPVVNGKQAMKYDTVFQTMGLCSTPQPVELVVNLAKHLDMENPNARIFLLEHGRSYRPWLNRMMDNSAEKHAEVHGCWYNRDITALVEEAAVKSGLEIKSEKRHHWGTTYIFELGPKKRKTMPALRNLSEITGGETTESKGWLGSLWSR